MYLFTFSNWDSFLYVTKCKITLRSCERSDGLVALIKELMSIELYEEASYEDTEILCAVH